MKPPITKADMAKQVRGLADQIQWVARRVSNDCSGPENAFLIPAAIDLELREIRMLAIEALCIMETAGWSTGDDGTSLGNLAGDTA